MEVGAIELSAPSGSVLRMASPMLALTEPTVSYRSVDPPMAVDAYVDSWQDTTPGWNSATLREWTLYESVGWTALVSFSVEPGQNFIGRFLAEHVREVGE